MSTLRPFVGRLPLGAFPNSMADIVLPQHRLCGQRPLATGIARAVRLSPAVRTPLGISIPATLFKHTMCAGSARRRPTNAPPAPVSSPVRQLPSIFYLPLEKGGQGGFIFVCIFILSFQNAFIWNPLPQVTRQENLSFRASVLCDRGNPVFT